MKIILSQEYGSSLSESAHHVSISIRHAIQEECTCGRGAYTGSVDQVFLCDGNAMKRASPFAASDFLFGLPGFSQRRIPGYRDKCIQNWIDSLDARKTFPGQFNG